MPKIDLHRHLTGAVNAKMAIQIAAEYNVSLPTYIESELDAILSKPPRKRDLQDYFSPWKILNGLLVSCDAVYDIILRVIQNAAEDNVVYVELRVGPNGFLGTNPKSFSFEEFAETVAKAVADAETKFGTIARCLLGIPRHLFKDIPDGIREKMLAKIAMITSSFKPHCFVGVDLNGVETAQGAEPFKTFFKIAHQQGLHTSVHAGEVGPASNVSYAIDELKASRIGHGLASIETPDLLQTLAERECALEICPTSSVILGIVDRTEDLPLKVFSRYGVPFVICTDNPGSRCKTSISEEFYKVANAFSLSLFDLRTLTLRALKYSFADEATKKKVALKLHLAEEDIDNGSGFS
ncbi:MAG: adenosine deaminase [bacterium]